MRFHLRPGVRRLFRLPPWSPAAARRDIDDELETLIASRVEYLVARGMPPGDARDEALRRLGASLDDARFQLHSSAEHRERRMRLSEFVESIIQDVHYAARGLIRRPAFTAVAVLTLAIGVGATTAIFSAVNVLLLRPLPYPNPDELMKVTLVTPGRPGRPRTDQMVWSYPKFAAFRDAQHVFSELAVYAGDQVTLGGTEVERATTETVGATYLRTIGISPVRGRDFDRSIDAHAGAPHETIISYSLWNARYNADPSIVGKTIDVSGDPYTIIGVTPRDFRGLSGQAQLFIPVTTRPAEQLSEAQWHEFWVVGRRAPGVTPEQVAKVTATLGASVNEEFARGAKEKWSANAAPLNDARLAPDVRRSLLVLFGAVSLVLLIACVNVANLLLGRASARRREMAVRVAIGAGRTRLVRLLVTESVLLALLGAAASIAVAWVGVHALGTIDPATTLRTKRDSGLGAVAFSSISLDWTALAFTLAVSLVVGIVFGLAPALGATRSSLADALKADRGGSGSGIGASFGRRALVVVEVALALVLLAGSGLMIRSLAKLLATDDGFDGAGVLTMRLTLPQGMTARDSMPAFYDQLLERVRAVPGVADAAINNCAPLTGGCNGTAIRRLDIPWPDLGQSPPIGVHWASPTWFALMRVRLERGRLFTAADRVGSPKVIVINDAAAKAYWPNDNPIGKHIQIGQGGMEDAEVIGIVRGVRQKPDSAPGPDAYVSYAQAATPRMMIFVRSERDVSSLATDLRRAIHDVAPTIPVYDMHTMTERAASATAQARFRAVLLGLFALTALSLAAIGIYGVMSLVVTARTREIGIRIALGAERTRVLRLVIGEGIGLVSIGAVLGLAGALAATRALRGFLFDLTPSDPATYVAIVVVLGGAAMVASWLPARRAARVDPVVALRAD